MNTSEYNRKNSENIRRNHIKLGTITCKTYHPDLYIYMCNYVFMFTHTPPTHHYIIL